MTDTTHTLAALRGDPALQRRSQEAVEQAKSRWIAGPASEIAGALKRYADGQKLEDCEALSRIFSDHALALALIAPMLGEECEALGNFPLAHIPFRHQYLDGIGVLMLMEAGRAALSLVLYEQTTLPPARHVCFSDNDCCEIVLAGKGEGRRLTVKDETDGSAEIHAENLMFTAGVCNRFYGPDVTKLVDRLDGRLVMLRVSRSPERPSVSREYRIDDGALVHCAAGERQSSRQEMALALLGAMKRGDARDEMRLLALEQGNPNRWEALRQLLALDTAQGFACLLQVAGDPVDPLSAQAGKLKAQLLQSYPVLARLEAEPCPV